MSYDVYLVIDTGGTEPVEVWSRNHTSNTANMWRAAGCDIADFHGARAVDLAIAARKAALLIDEDHDKWAKYEPANRWGTVQSTVDFLTDIADACERHSATTVRVSR